MLIAITNGARFVEIPVNYLPRVGTSSATGSPLAAIAIGLRMIEMILRFRARTPRRIVRPERLSHDSGTGTGVERPDERGDLRPDRHRLRRVAARPRRRALPRQAGRVRRRLLPARPRARRRLRNRRPRRSPRRPRLRDDRDRSLGGDARRDGGRAPGGGGGARLRRRAAVRRPTASTWSSPSPRSTTSPTRSRSARRSPRWSASAGPAGGSSSGTTTRATRTGGC